MNTQLAFGVVILGGLLHGSFAFPMKRMERTWRWENVWLVYSVVAMILVPALLAWATVPSLMEVYAGVPDGALSLVALFGFGWGLGSTLFGLGISRVGMALTFAIILGITSSFGALLPLLVFHPADVVSRRGLILSAGLLVVIAGIICVAVAGGWRERDQKGTAAKAASDYKTGLLICIASGILSSMLNVGFTFGEPIKQAAVRFGARPDLAANAIWAPALAAGFLANGGYALYLLFRNHSWSVFGDPKAPRWHWIGAAVMGVLWFGGISLYGLGAAAMGPLGPVMGWPVFMSVVIIGANMLGFSAGEWQGAGAKAKRLSWTGIAILIAAIGLLSTAN